MHVHSFKEITDYFAKDDIDYPPDEILHVFECTCGFTIIEKKRTVESNYRQKKITIYTIVRK